eukprot:XP_025013049.1 probable carboxylesterase 12 [Ricinus communis]
MNPSANEIAYQLGSFFRAYKDGRVERCSNCARNRRISACIHSYQHKFGPKASSPSLFSRLAPEHPIPIAYEDSWAALKWIASHCDGGGPESWLNDHADFGRVFLGGDSAGANIAHNMGIQAGVEGLNGVKVLGICLVHPYFGRKESGVDECWTFVSPKTSGFNDLRINPSLDSRLARLGCSKVLIFVAEKDKLKERGVFYYETLRESEWDGEVEIVETEGEEHVFHLFNPSCENAFALLKKFASFINQRLIS